MGKALIHGTPSIGTIEAPVPILPLLDAMQYEPTQLAQPTQPQTPVWWEYLTPLPTLPVAYVTLPMQPIQC